MRQHRRQLPLEAGVVEGARRNVADNRAFYMLGFD